MAGGAGPSSDLGDADEQLARRDATRLVAATVGTRGLTVDEVLASSRRTGPERLLDPYIRAGPHGDHFGHREGELTLVAVAAQPHGIDLGPPP